MIESMEEFGGGRFSHNLQSGLLEIHGYTSVIHNALRVRLCGFSYNVT